MGTQTSVNPDDTVTIFELEAAINYWRNVAPADTNGMVLSAEVNALSEPYAWLIVNHAREIPVSAFGSKASAVWQRYCEVIADQQRRVA